MDNEYREHVYHSEVTWISQVIGFTLKDESAFFLAMKKEKAILSSDILIL